MNKQEIIKQIIYSYFKNDLPKYIEREKVFDFLDVRKVYTIVWPRRAWKTYFLYQIIDNLLKKGIDKKQTLYFFLERDDIYPIWLEELNLILEIYFSIVWYDRSKKYYIFLDEIQIVKDREKFALKVYIQFPNVELVLTGSSSKMLSKEIYSWLRWKAFSKEILPLTVKESLKFKELDIEKLSLEEKFKLRGIFEEILFYWLFPEVVLQNQEYLKTQLLEEYLDMIFYKDIIERYKFRSFEKLKKFRRILFSYIANFINFSKISEIVWVSENVVLKWFNAFKEAYSVFELKNFDFSIWKQEKSRWKLYLIDNWFYWINFGLFKQDLWVLFENLVFLEFKKRWLDEEKNIFYFKNKDFDIDFLIFNKDISFVQVVYELNDDNFEREVGQLSKIKAKYNKPAILIYNCNNLKTKKIPKEIIAVDFWNYIKMLEEF